MPFSTIQRQIIDEQGQAVSFGPIGPGRVAVVTGAASGIGLAAAQVLARQGMKLALCDINLELLERVGKEIVDDVFAGDSSSVILMKVDVSKFEEMVAFREKVLDQFGEVNVLMLNAAVFVGGGTFADNLPVWRKMIDVNLFGVINGTQAFVPFLQNQENDSVVIVTGSKQGITGPPGNAAYNVSKAAVKMLTEQLACELREAHSNCSAHLFVPGWVHTGAGGPESAAGEKPAGAWTAKETVAYMLEKLEKGDFYIVCPDNETSEDMDKLRMAWGASDLLLNRPALSRWHPEYKRKFEEYMREGLNPAAPGRSRSRGRGGDGYLTPSGERADSAYFGGAEVEIRDGGRRTPAE
ncbi:hypothetical protein BDY24DRAFT_378232 [Mrakia frigida]|uniref:SDR family NAD(P)-dependent oxidoreductase n=1 Tax=Mrakia frigida TaxID=29902 RepID=UPI003FCC1C57